MRFVFVHVCLCVCCVSARVFMCVSVDLRKSVYLWVLITWSAYQLVAWSVGLLDGLSKLPRRAGS